MTGNGPVRVAVVGVGHFGRNHARIYAGMEGVELAVIADPDAARRDAMCDLYGCRGVADHTEIGDIGSGLEPGQRPFVDAARLDITVVSLALDKRMGLHWRLTSAQAPIGPLSEGRIYS